MKRGLRSTGILLAACVAFTLAGCASGSPMAAPSPAPTTTEDAPTPTADPILQAPAQVFGGDCDAVLTAAEAGEALGTSMSAWTRPSTSPKTRPQDFVVSQLGGLECNWKPSAEGTMAGLGIVVLPATLMEPTASTVPYCYGADSGTAGTGSCKFNVADAGLWLSGVVYTPAGTTNDDARAAISELSDTFTANAAAAPGFVPSPAASGLWTEETSTDCTALATSTPVAGILAGTGITAVPGNAADELPDGYYRALESATGNGCMWSRETATGPEHVFDTIALPGGAWVQTQLAALPGVTEVTIAGVERAMLSLSSPGPGLAPATALDVFDGPNWLHIDLQTMRDPGSYGPLAAAFVSALNGAP